jgi:hypothetical protein
VRARRHPNLRVHGTIECKEDGITVHVNSHIQNWIARLRAGNYMCR